MMTKSKLLKIIISWALVLIWMSVIFSLSAQNDTQSSGLSEKIVSFIAGIIKVIEPVCKINMNVLHLVVRKAAHFTIYFLLGIFVTHALRKSEKERVLISLIICILYALSDEFHQSFVPGRVASFIDVGIDSLGALLGSCIFSLIKNRLSINKKKIYD